MKKKQLARTLDRIQIWNPNYKIKNKILTFQNPIWKKNEFSSGSLSMCVCGLEEILNFLLSFIVFFPLSSFAFYVSRKKKRNSKCFNVNFKWWNVTIRCFVVFDFFLLLREWLILTLCCEPTMLAQFTIKSFLRNFVDNYYQNLLRTAAYTYSIHHIMLQWIIAFVFCCVLLRNWALKSKDGMYCDNRE